MRRRGFVIGLALVAIYVVAVTVTVAARDDHVRPLYDGFAPPPAYQFVDPPPFFAAQNVKPDATSTVVALGAEGSEAAGIATPDGQLAISLARGAISPVEGATQVSVRVTPLAPGDLAPLPDGLRGNGNVYRIEMSYQPQGGPVTRFAKPGTLLMEIPELGDRLFASPDGDEWAPIASRTVPPRELAITATLRRPGYYLAATNLPELAGPTASDSHAALVIGVVVAGVAAVMFLGVYLLARRRRRVPR